MKNEAKRGETRQKVPLLSRVWSVTCARDDTPPSGPPHHTTNPPTQRPRKPPQGRAGRPFRTPRMEAKRPPKTTPKSDICAPIGEAKRTAKGGGGRRRGGDAPTVQICPIKTRSKPTKPTPKREGKRRKTTQKEAKNTPPPTQNDPRRAPTPSKILATIFQRNSFPKNYLEKRAFLGAKRGLVSKITRETTKGVAKVPNWTWRKKRKWHYEGAQGRFGHEKGPRREARGEVVTRRLALSSMGGVALLLCFGRARIGVFHSPFSRLINASAHATAKLAISLGYSHLPSSRHSVSVLCQSAPPERIPCIAAFAASRRYASQSTLGLLFFPSFSLYRKSRSLAR